MATLIRTEQGCNPEPNPLPSGEPLLPKETELSSRTIGSPLRSVASALFSPVVAAIALLGFTVVMADLTWYRLRSFCKDRPQPRGLWDL